MTKQSPDPNNRVERILAYMMIAVIGLSVISFLAVIIGTLAGLGRADYAAGIWPLVTVIPRFALPFAVVLLITLVVVSARRRARAAAAQRAVAARTDSRGKPLQGK